MEEEEIKEQVKEKSIKLELSEGDINAIFVLFNIAIKSVGLEDNNTFNNVNYFMQQIHKAKNE